MLPSPDFESGASAIPPLRHIDIHFSIQKKEPSIFRTSHLFFFSFLGKMCLSMNGCDMIYIFLFTGDDTVNIKLVLLGILALFSLYRLYEHNDFLTLCATVIVVAAFVLSSLYVWRNRD